LSVYREKTFALPESIERTETIIGRYIIRVNTPDYLKYTGMLAVEGSTGSWIPLPLETPELIEQHGAKVISVFEIPDYEYEVPEGKRTVVVEIAYPTVNIGTQIPMLLNTLIGVISNFGDLKLVDIELPESFVNAFAGPKYGVGGLREYLKTPTRPLCCCVMKPCIGMSAKQTGEIFYDVASGGIDIVKDDEKLANTTFSTVSDRVRECMAAEKRVFEESGDRTFYAVNITDEPDKVLDNAKAAIDAGGNMLMVSHLTTGFGVLRKLAESSDIDMPIMVHPDFAGGVSRSHRLGMSSHLALGKLPRLCGADISDIPTHYGAVPITQEKCTKVAISLRIPFWGVNKALPLLGGAFHPGMVKAVVDDLGFDIAVGAGGAIHAHPQGANAGVKAFRQAIDAAVAGRDLREASKEHKELHAAISAWGMVGE
jgi:2,3-diketo-5-methylthiopentyl-1-phosphate enolase